MNAIIFGASGQDGQYLSKLLAAKGIKVIGISRSKKFLQTDITEFEQIHKLVDKNKPDYIFHLAANSTTRHDAWQENHETICTGSLNMLEAVHKTSPDTKIFLSGSGLQFRNNGKPIKETDPFEATSQYAISRIHSVYAARYYRSLGIKAYVGYFFNHDSPLRSEKHISKKISEAVKRIHSGIEEKLEIGNISVRKEWGYAGDIVNGLWALVNQENIFEAIIGTGEAYSIEQWLEACFSLIGKDWHDYVVESKTFISEYKTLVSNPALINSLGWQPEISFHQLAKMMLQS
jgi:GDPmannose 4,6-dehydratase